MNSEIPTTPTCLQSALTEGTGVSLVVRKNIQAMIDKLDAFYRADLAPIGFIPMESVSFGCEATAGHRDVHEKRAYVIGNSKFYETPLASDEILSPSRAGRGTG